MASILKADKIEGVTASGTVQMPAGHVIQTVQKIDTATTTFSNSGSSATFVTCGSLSQSFTPKFSTSKVLLKASLGHVATNTADRFAFFRFSGGNTANGVGDASSSRQRVLAFHYFAAANDGTSINFEYLDSPNTNSAITYAVEIAPNYSNGNLGLNYYYPNNTDAVYIPVSASTLTIMEIAQ
jgi:hypothetical protein